MYFFSKPKITMMRNMIVTQSTVLILMHAPNLKPSTAIGAETRELGGGDEGNSPENLWSSPYTATIMPAPYSVLSIFSTTELSDIDIEKKSRYQGNTSWLMLPTGLYEHAYKRDIEQMELGRKEGLQTCSTRFQLLKRSPKVTQRLEMSEQNTLKDVSIHLI